MVPQPFVVLISNFRLRLPVAVCAKLPLGNLSERDVRWEQLMSAQVLVGRDEPFDRVAENHQEPEGAVVDAKGGVRGAEQVGCVFVTEVIWSGINAQLVPGAASKVAGVLEEVLEPVVRRSVGACLIEIVQLLVHEVPLIRL
eukprot:CAMPEP_0170183328 /NCGR_PEP_ID=MMETSP0040_2-20121228/30359_1 /TAXON_ID=641309 /ORGANISM="Lotharella oceanica, Strain CCMP622" /LENGTH=141 /DNA_ID=CAMNT_0010429023 /DNA_START=704 /DNA_END=1129 /DNA_ORIENTATION=-